MAVPIRLTARRVTGVGDVAGGILANLAIDGMLKVTAKTLTGEGLALDFGQDQGQARRCCSIWSPGDYNVSLSGGLTRYLIPGIGIVDVLTELKVVPGAGRARHAGRRARAARGCGGSTMPSCDRWPAGCR